MTEIRINRTVIDWPKAVIREDQLRQYAEAGASKDVWQNDPVRGQAVKIIGVADLRQGTNFFTAPKTEG